jgi:hypothetical protein
MFSSRNQTTNHFRLQKCVSSPNPVFYLFLDVIGLGHHPVGGCLGRGLGRIRPQVHAPGHHSELQLILVNGQSGAPGGAPGGLAGGSVPKPEPLHVSLVSVGKVRGTRHDCLPLMLTHPFPSFCLKIFAHMDAGRFVATRLPVGTFVPSICASRKHRQNRCKSAVGMRRSGTAYF